MKLSKEMVELIFDRIGYTAVALPMFVAAMCAWEYLDGAMLASLFMGLMWFAFQVARR